MTKEYTKYYRWLPSVLWMGFIFFLSHQEAGSSSQLSSGITKTLYNVINSVLPWLDLELAFFHFLVRKGAHFNAYLILGLLLAKAMKPDDRKAYFSVLLLCIFYAMSDEFHQTFVSGRSGEVRDVLIDSTGSLTGILLYAGAGLIGVKRKIQKAGRETA